MKTSIFSRSARWLLLAAALGTAGATPEYGPDDDAETADFIAVDVQADQRMAGSKVEVAIDNGIATLTGTALSLDQAERAAARALTTDSVRAVVNRLEISDPGTSDAQLADRTELRLKNSLALDASRIRVVVDDRRAVLLGQTGTWDEQELAREIASEVAGIRQIDNRLEVTFDTIRTDRAIRAQIERLVADDPLYAGLRVNVEVNDGIVSLAGEVGSTGEKDQLVHRAHVTGVTEVWADDIMVNRDLAMEGMSGKVPSGTTVLKSLASAISKDPRLDRADVHAAIDAKVITLTGTAPSEDARAAAESNARGLPGAWSIANQIQVIEGTARNSSAGTPLATIEE
ncbi:BON domain-containing protein [Luteolibacter marinus]|uniref:BON domain-containing protein n=1 Tax=Luteolibacter marinus TaxID=2776705 RepID=UPI0018663170|nr:BON domain-containing protein [Luteolibacter marinus]